MEVSFMVSPFFFALFLSLSLTYIDRGILGGGAKKTNSLFGSKAATSKERGGSKYHILQY